MALCTTNHSLRLDPGREEDQTQNQRCGTTRKVERRESTPTPSQAMHDGLLDDIGARQSSDEANQHNHSQWQRHTQENFRNTTEALRRAEMWRVRLRKEC